jgi:hypothetical protein
MLGAVVSNFPLAESLELALSAAGVEYLHGPGVEIPHKSRRLLTPLFFSAVGMGSLMVPGQTA